MRDAEPHDRSGRLRRVAAQAINIAAQAPLCERQIESGEAGEGPRNRAGCLPPAYPDKIVGGLIAVTKI